MRKKIDHILPEIPNPFANSLIIPTRWILDIKKGTNSAFESRQIDIEQHVKVYPSLMSYLIVATTMARSIIVHIMKRVENSKFDYIELTPSGCSMPKSTFYKAVDELTKNMVIRSRKEVRKNTYWINPAMMFRGNRLDRFEDRAQAINTDPLAHVKEAYAKQKELENEHTIWSKSNGVVADRNGHVYPLLPE